MSKHYSAGELLLWQRVKKQVDDTELFSKKAWKNPAGPLFGKLNVFYYITAIYSFFVFLLNELVLFQLYHSAYLKMTTEQEVFFGKNQWLVHGVFLLAIVCFVFMLCKKRSVAYLLQLITGVLMVVQIVQVFNGVYANQAALGTMYLFALLPLLTVIGMMIIQIFYNHRVKVAVENELHLLYNQYGNEDGLMSAEEWDTVLETYENKLLN